MRIFPVLSVASLVLLTTVGCSKSKEASASQPEKVETSVTVATTAPAPLPASSPSSATTAAQAPSAAKADPDARPDLGAVIGTRKDGWSPKIIAKLKRGMSPEDVAKALPGTEAPSKFGFAKYKPTVGGVDEIEFYFAKKDNVPKELQSVKIKFDGNVSDEALWKELLKTCIEKYGSAKPADIEKKLVTWAGPKSGMAQLYKGYHELDGWQLSVTLQR